MPFTDGTRDHVTLHVTRNNRIWDKHTRFEDARKNRFTLPRCLNCRRAEKPSWHSLALKVLKPGRARVGKDVSGRKGTIESIYAANERENGNERQRWRKLSFIVKERQEEALS